MATMVPGNRTILSVYPDRHSIVLNHNGFKTYEHPVAPTDEILVRTFIPKAGMWCPKHPADKLSRIDYERHMCGRCKSDLVEIPQWEDEHRECEKGQGYTLMHIYDTHQWTADYSTDAERYIARPVDAQEVCYSLVKQWSTDMPNATTDARPGVMMIVEDSPSPDELALVRRVNTAFFAMYLDEGVGLFAQGQGREVRYLHRLAAKSLGRYDLSWVKEVKSNPIKRCVGCGKDIFLEATTCEHCQQFLPDLYKKLRIEVTSDSDPAVHAYLERLKVPPPDRLKVQQPQPVA